MNHKFTFAGVLKRLGWAVGFVIFYFFVIRPIRAFYSEVIVYEILLSSKNVIGNITSSMHAPREVVITFMSNSSEHVISHIPQLGFFFLCGMIGLVFFKAEKTAYMGLAIFQLVIEILVLFLFWLGIYYTVSGFIMANFLMLYISPLGCLGFIVFVSMAKK